MGKKGREDSRTRKMGRKVWLKGREVKGEREEARWEEEEGKVLGEGREKTKQES